MSTINNRNNIETAGTHPAVGSHAKLRSSNRSVVVRRFEYGAHNRTPYS
jgi:hypothetical protein